MKIATNLDEARELIGGFGLNGWCIFVLACLCEMKICGMLYVWPIYELQPKYVCQDSSNQNWYQCLPEAFCGNPSIEYQVDYTDPASINSLYNRIHLECESKEDIALIGMSLFLGLVTGCIITPRIADLYNRKVVTSVGNITVLIFYICIL